jgi:hypothetical protein
MFSQEQYESLVGPTLSRMEITGASWRMDRADAVRKIRVLKSSGDFGEYWTFHKTREFQRNHVSKLQESESLLAA